MAGTVAFVANVASIPGATCNAAAGVTPGYTGYIGYKPA